MVQNLWSSFRIIDPSLYDARDSSRNLVTYEEDDYYDDDDYLYDDDLGDEFDSDFEDHLDFYM